MDDINDNDAHLEGIVSRDDGQRDPGGKEVHGDFNGYVLDVGGVAKGHFEMDLANDKVIFHWEDTSSAWPSQFKLAPPGGYSVPTTTHAETFEHKSFTATATSHDVSGCQYELRYGTTTFGWMRYDSHGTTWYAIASKLTKDGLIDAPELEFVPNTVTSAVTAIKLYDSSL